MTERISKLKETVDKDEAKIIKLQEGVKKKKEKIRELENAEIMNNLNAISAQGIDINKIVTAIRENDVPVLMSLMTPEKNNQTEKSGTSSAFSNLKEDNENE